MRYAIFSRFLGPASRGPLLEAPKSTGSSALCGFAAHRPNTDHRVCSQCLFKRLKICKYVLNVM